MNIFAKAKCWIFGHKITHPKTPRKCKWCNFKFPGYCKHNWVYDLHTEKKDIYFYHGDPYAPKPVLYKPAEDYVKWNSESTSNLLCTKCNIRIHSMHSEKYISGEWE